MPAFRAFYRARGHLNVPQSHGQLGQLVRSIRSGRSVPPRYEDELQRMGLGQDTQRIAQRDAMWQEYMPAFRAYRDDNAHINIPRSHPLGVAVHRIQTGNTPVPPQHEAELVATGLDLRNQRLVQRDARWEEYMPAFRAHREQNGRANIPRSHPILGKLVSSIRAGRTMVPPQHEAELVAMGLDHVLRNQHMVQRDAR